MDIKEIIMITCEVCKKKKNEKVQWKMITSASIRYFIKKEKVAKNMHIKFGERVKSRIK